MCETRQIIFVIVFPRYMNISDEWETPEKQPFKDFVSVLNRYQQIKIGFKPKQ